MNIITENLIQSKPVMDSIQSFCDKYVTKKVLSSCGIKKQADIEEEQALTYAVPKNWIDNSSEEGSNETIFITEPIRKVKAKCIAARRLFIDYLNAFLLSFSIYFLMKEKMYFDGYEKDTLYRFLEIKGANWEKLQTTVAASLVADIEEQTSDDHTNVLAIDDSLYRRSGNGRGTELCGKVFDHNDRKMRIGYRMMTAVWTNGDVTIPVSQVLLTTKDPELQVGKFDKKDGRTIEGKRQARALTKGTDTVTNMVKLAQENKIPFKYVLFDTWFSKPSQLVALKNLGTDVIAMIAKGKTKFTVIDPNTQEPVKRNVKEIYSMFKKRPGKSRYLLSVKATATDSNGQSIEVKLVFARNRNNRKDWICIVCTDSDLDEGTILSTYTLRWNIEVYFKTVKSYMRLTSECHSTKYDALTAHMVLVAIRYMALVFDTFRREESRSIDEIFEQAKREVINHMINSALTIIIDCLIDAIMDLLHLTDEQMEQIYSNFYNRLPPSWRERFNSPEKKAV